MELIKIDAKVRTNAEAAIHMLIQFATIQYQYGVEVGVREGDFSKELLHRFPLLSMSLVDPYAPYLDVGDYQYTQEMQDAIKLKAKEKLAPYVKCEFFSHDRVSFIEEDSLSAAGRADKLSADFVYIDANHEYSHVVKDIEAWWPVVRRGGLLCGHDFSMGGVQKAIGEFAGDRKVYHIYGTTGDADSWFIYK